MLPSFLRVYNIALSPPLDAWHLSHRAVIFVRVAHPLFVPPPRRPSASRLFAAAARYPKGGGELRDGDSRRGRIGEARGYGAADRLPDTALGG